MVTDVINNHPADVTAAAMELSREHCSVAQAAGARDVPPVAAEHC